MRAFGIALLVCAIGCAGAAGGARADAPSVPAFAIQSLAAPTKFIHDEGGADRYQVFVTNDGAAPTDGSPITVTDVLPPGVGVVSVRAETWSTVKDFGPEACSSSTVEEVSTVVCEFSEVGVHAVPHAALLIPGGGVLIEIKVAVPSSLSGRIVSAASVEGGGAAPVSTTRETEVGDQPGAPGLEEWTAEATGRDGLPVSSAGSRPYEYTTSFAANTELVEKEALGTVGGSLKNISVQLPPGLVANPTAIPRCTLADFNQLDVPEESYIFNECPDDSAVGVVILQQLEGAGGLNYFPIYNLVPEWGMPAQFGFNATLGVPIFINTRLRTDGELGVEAYLTNVNETIRATAARTVFWGVPALPAHDGLRGRCAVTSSGQCPYEAESAPFLRMPTDCGAPLRTPFSIETWAKQPALVGEDFESPALGDCAAPDFSPMIDARPGLEAADSPTGLDFKLHLPQAEHESGPSPEGEAAEADLRDVSVTLPPGLVVNPSSANGLGSCSTSQIGLTTPVGQATPIHFDSAPAGCPDAAKIGTVEAVAPAVDHPLKGSVYLADQERNPFGSLLAIYLVLEDPETGIVVKLAAKVTPDPVTGRLTTALRESPQLPVEDFRLRFFDGNRASLRTPRACGAYTTNALLTPWTAPAAPVASASDSFNVSSGPTGGPCPTGGLAPQFSAGLTSGAAGTYSPLVLRLARADATAEFISLSTTTPKGLSARFAGIPYCSEAGIAQAVSRSSLGDGVKELTSPSCPAASQVGEITVGAGAGPSPYFTGGKVYLAGPYRGSPLSFVAIVPAVAGPFDLGVVTDRIALEVDRRTVQATAVADPFPSILAGVPLDVRELRVNLNRPHFTLAPTSCAPTSSSATVQGVGDATAKASSFFQLAGCGHLAFKPKLSLGLRGKTNRTGHPALKAVLTYPKAASANIASAQVSLPHSEFLDQSNIGTVCTQARLAAATCPAKSIYGWAKAWTPLLDKPLEGPVYLGVGYGHTLPDLVADLNGQIRVLLNGRVDSDPQGGLRNTFEAVPDAPVSKFMLELSGGPKKGLLENSENLCRHTQRASVKFTGQNGKVERARLKIANRCGQKRPKGKTRHRGGKK
jgi:uncharacterized repeat protein (TIGR01451 family)